MTPYVCCQDDVRKNAVRNGAVPFNGIDFLEVVDDGTQLNLRVHFLKPITISLDRRNVHIEGGERVIDPEVDTTSVNGDVLEVRVVEPGDFTPYTLRIVAGTLSDDPPPGIDPLLAAVRFTFKVNCPQDFDCKVERVCPPDAVESPQIDYLAKDYASFRQLMLDRLNVLMPDWRSREAADLGIVLVELLAYVGDQLSYFQDAVATEAYLATARRRVSVRRHARLVDYFMHDGCNARTWVQIQLPPPDGLPDGGVLVERGRRLLTSVPGLPPVLDETSYRLALGSSPEVFETMHDVVAYRANQDLALYAWGERECCLPVGSTTATLRGLPALAAGDVLVLAERLGPETGNPADADPAHRQAVRLIAVRASSDAIGGRFEDQPTADPVDVTEIEWHADDALRFPLCLSAETDSGYHDDVGHALGNIVLADHGRTVNAEEQLPENRVEHLGVVPDPVLFRPPQGDRCADRVRAPVAPRFRPSPAESPVTQAAPFDPAHRPASATAATTWATEDAMPKITLFGTAPGAEHALDWDPERDLLDAGPTTRAFVVEVESDGTARIRFGDDVFGLRPSSGTSFDAVYRVGNGRAGNVGAGALAHIVLDGPSPITGVTNPLPATGGVDPEDSERVRQNAPAAFRTQRRAVTLEDYADVTERKSGIQRAAASVRWTGSWPTVFVTVDRLGGQRVDGPFREEITRYLDGYRMAGQDVDVDGPQFASLDVELFVCVRPDFFRTDVEQQLRQVFSSGTLPDGRRGFFHPDNFTFGQPVWLSGIYAAAQAVAGVQSVEVTKFQRQGDDESDARDSGVLRLARLEIARLEQNPDFPEHGKLAIQLGGGK